MLAYARVLHLSAPYFSLPKARSCYYLAIQISGLGCSQPIWADDSPEQGLWIRADRLDSRYRSLNPKVPGSRPGRPTCSLSRAPWPIIRRGPLPGHLSVKAARPLRARLEPADDAMLSSRSRPWGCSSWQRRCSVERSATTGATRSRGGLRRRRLPTARPTSCWWCSTTSASPSSAATAPTSTLPRSTGWPPSGVRLANFHTTALCSPTRACLLTGRNHHRSGMGRVADLAIGFPGYWGRPPKENGFLSEILRATVRHLRRREVAPHPRGRDPHGRLPCDWPLGRGFDRWYGFHGGETHQFVPALYHDNHASGRRRAIEDGYHLSADLADRAIEFLGDLRAVDAERPFFLYFCTGACHSPAPCARRVDRALPRASSTTAGTRWREQTFARQLELGHRPRGDRPLAPPALGAGLGRASTTAQRAVAGRFMECFAAFLSYTDAADRPRARLPRRPGDARRHGRRSWSRTTAPAPRVARRARSTTAGSRTSTRPAGRDVRAHRRDRRAADPQQLPVGLDHGRATRPSSGGSARSTREGSPTRASSAGRRGCGARRGGPPTSSPTRSTCCRPCSSWPGSSRPTEIDGSPRRTIDGIELRLPARPGGRSSARRHGPSTSRCSGPRASTTTDGRR